MREGLDTEQGGSQLEGRIAEYKKIFIEKLEFGTTEFQAARDLVRLRILDSQVSKKRLQHHSITDDGGFTLGQETEVIGHQIAILEDRIYQQGSTVPGYHRAFTNLENGLNSVIKAGVADQSGVGFLKKKLTHSEISDRVISKVEEALILKMNATESSK